MHSKLADAIQQIDAAVFNGDSFDEHDARNELLEYLARWKKRLVGVRRCEEPACFDHREFGPGEKCIRCKMCGLYICNSCCVKRLTCKGPP